MNRPVSVQLIGGLGNQLFQWSAAYALSRRLQTNLVLDFQTIKGKSLDPRKLELGYFSIPTSPSPIPPWIWFQTKLVSTRVRENSPTVFRESGFEYDPRFESIFFGQHLTGYFQSWKYFEAYSAHIRKLLLTGAQPTKEYFDFFERVEGKKWAAIHVRRGDYANFPEIFVLLDRSYYKRAIESLPDRNFDEVVVFSEDPKAARMLVPEATIIADSFKVSAAGDVVSLLSKAQAVVGANSSLSWWGAFLNEGPGENKIFPIDWFGPMGWSTKDLIPSEWTLL